MRIVVAAGIVVGLLLIALATARTLLGPPW